MARQHAPAPQHAGPSTTSAAAPQAHASPGNAAAQEQLGPATATSPTPTLDAASAAGGFLEGARDFLYDLGADAIGSLEDLLTVLGTLGEDAAKRLLLELSRIKPEVVLAYLVAGPTGPYALYLLERLDTALVLRFFVQIGAEGVAAVIELAADCGQLAWMVQRVLILHLDFLYDVLLALGEATFAAFLDLAGQDAQALLTGLMCVLWPLDSGLKIAGEGDLAAAYKVAGELGLTITHKKPGELEFKVDGVISGGAESALGGSAGVGGGEGAKAGEGAAEGSLTGLVDVPFHHHLLVPVIRAYATQNLIRTLQDPQGRSIEAVGALFKREVFNAIPWLHTTSIGGGLGTSIEVAGDLGAALGWAEWLNQKLEAEAEVSGEIGVTLAPEWAEDADGYRYSPGGTFSVHGKLAAAAKLANRLKFLSLPKGVDGSGELEGKISWKVTGDPDAGLSQPTFGPPELEISAGVAAGGKENEVREGVGMDVGATFDVSAPEDLSPEDLFNRLKSTTIAMTLGLGSKVGKKLNLALVGAGALDTMLPTLASGQGWSFKGTLTIGARFAPSNFKRLLEEGSYPPSSEGVVALLSDLASLGTGTVPPRLAKAIDLLVQFFLALTDKFAIHAEAGVHLGGKGKIGAGASIGAEGEASLRGFQKIDLLAFKKLIEPGDIAAMLTGDQRTPDELAVTP